MTSLRVSNWAQSLTFSRHRSGEIARLVSTSRAEALSLPVVSTSPRRWEM
jgi:hypothetical protein